jgi:outer membrane lipoprotein
MQGTSERVAAVVLGLFLVFAQACSHVVSSQMRATARKDISFPMILQDPLAYRGATVILGGFIIQTENRPRGTELMVLETPLDSLGRPEDRELSRGRFVAESSSYLDPEVYSRGKKVVLAGEVAGASSRPLGETSYRYPVLTVKELHVLEPGERFPFLPYFSFGVGYVSH